MNYVALCVFVNSFLVFLAACWIAPSVYPVLLAYIAGVGMVSALNMKDRSHE